MTDTIRPARTDTFEHTISGLLTKRADLFREAERIRDRLAEIKNDVAAMDRVLGTLGYKGDLDAAMPRQKREVIFGRGELTRACVDELREAEGPADVPSDRRSHPLRLRPGRPRPQPHDRPHQARGPRRCGALKGEGRVNAAKDMQGTMVWALAAL